MFKIPTYDELEKKEKETGKEFSLNLFQKRKILNEEQTEEIKINDSDKESQSKETTRKLLPMSPSKIIKNNDENENEDDDQLLSMFLAQNKDLIEKSSNEKKSSLPEISNSNDMEIEDEVLLKLLSNDESKAKTSSNVLDKDLAPKKLETITLSANSGGAHGSVGGGSLIISSRQRGNLILKHIRNVQWKYCDQLTPDFQMSKTTCGFFLSMKYHLLNPTYIHKRVKELGKAYNLRVLLALVDVKEPRHCIKELEKVCIFSNLTMILCWSNEEVARYLETYKAYEFKSADSIMEKASTTGSGNQYYSNASNATNSDSNFVNSLTDFMCQIKSINKTDASTLRQTFGSITQLSMASKEELNLCPGLGPLKVNRLYETFRTPFILSKKN